MAPQKPQKKPSLTQRYKTECGTKKQRATPNCKALARQIRSLRIDKESKRTTTVIPKVSPKMVDADLFSINPIAFYRKMIQSYAEEQTYSDYFKTGQTYNAIVLEEVFINPKTDISLFFPLSPKGPTASDSTATVSALKKRIFRVFIPDLDRSVGLTNDPKENVVRIQAFLNGSDRLAFYSSTDTLTPGYLVEVGNAVGAESAAKMPSIIRKISDEPVIDIGVNLSEGQVKELKECFPQLKLKPPATRPQAAPRPSVTPQTVNFDGAAIYSPSDNENAEVKHPRLLSVSPPPPSIKEPPPETPEQKKAREIKEIMTLKGDTETCPEVILPVIEPKPEPVQKSAQKEKPKSKNIYVDEINTLTSLNIKHEFDKVQEEALNKFLKDQEITKPAYYDVSEDQTSASPVVYMPPKTREPSLIVIKEAPYTTFEEYFIGSKINHADAAHFCIGEKGEINQLADLNHVIKSYNPTINESAVQIAVLNISNTISQQTRDFLKNKNDSIEYSINLTIKYNLDAWKLKNFYKKKGLDKKDVKFVGLPRGFLRDKSLRDKYLYSRLLLWEKDMIPDYRLDITDEQKKVLKKIVEIISSTYNIQANIPKGYLLGKQGEQEFLVQKIEPSIAAGDYSGICCPYNFLQTSTNGIFHLNEIFDNFTKVEL